MKALLMHRDRDFDLERELPSRERELTQDLELTTLFDAMARGDQFLFDMARRTVLSSLRDPREIVYRQQVLADALERPGVVRELYELAVEAGLAQRKVPYHWLSDSPDSILHRSVQVLELLVHFLRRLRAIADEQASSFGSEGFTRLFGMLAEGLSDEYFEAVEEHLAELRFRQGTTISAQLGKGAKGTRHVLRRTRARSWRERVSRSGPPSYGFTIPDRDENGFKALSELRGRGIALVADALAQSTEHVLGFFGALRAELAFYVGCLNLHERLAGKGEPVSFPVPAAAGELALSARGLYDPCLSLHLDGRAVGNDVDAERRSLVMITGANQGGKSTFLRSVGLAQLMTQCGMFAPARSFRASVCDGVFTHYKREEDATMRSGKLDEELARMSEIADAIGPGCVLLCNESFAATNEREGSEIARQIVRALLESGVRVLFVTHLYDLAHGLCREGLDSALFLRAERRPDGRRTFRLVEGEPLPTSYGEDSFRRVFDDAAEVARAVGR